MRELDTQLKQDVNEKWSAERVRPIRPEKGFSTARLKEIGANGLKKQI